MRTLVAIGALCLLTSCRTAAPTAQAHTLVSTQESSTPEEPTPSDKNIPSPAQQNALEALVARDAPRAAAILTEALIGADTESAARAGIYILRLGVTHDNATVLQAISTGVKSPDPLTRCLCYRWLASLKTSSLPPLRSSGIDPVTAVFASLAHRSRGRIPDALSTALALFDGTGTETDSSASFDDRVAGLQTIAMAVDDGALALAISFHEARREGAMETIGNEAPTPIALRYRTELLHFLGLDPSPPLLDRIPRPFEISRIRNALIPSLNVPLDGVRRLCVDATGSLQREALWALAISALNPVSGDLAAAAAGMESADPLNRVEAARTYLLLTARATEKTR